MFSLNPSVLRRSANSSSYSLASKQLGDETAVEHGGNRYYCAISHFGRPLRGRLRHTSNISI